MHYYIKMPKNSPRLTLEGSFSHAQLRELSEQYPTHSMSISSCEGTAALSALDATYSNDKGVTINPLWYELYPLENGEILPLVTRSLLRRGYHQLYKKDSDVPSRVWNAIEEDACKSKRSIADFVHTLPIMRKYGPSRQLMGIRADRMNELVDRADELDIYNMQRPGSQSRNFIAAYANNLLAFNQ